jgi:hypothetical protein
VKSLALLFIRSPVRDWVWLFLAINTFITIAGAVNPASRWATLVSMVEYGSVRIDHYVDHTCDWARTPDGHYYSNKAPGPVLLGYPIFWVMDKMDTLHLPNRQARDIRRAHEQDSNLHTLSILTQVIPFAIVTLLLINELQKLAVPLAALHLSALALLFGNTASLFTNTYFGHSMAAAWVLYTVLCIHRRMPFWLGLCFGLAVLCDYMNLLLAPPLLIALTMTGQMKWPKLGRIIGGGAAPALVFVIYHWYCFGGPFTLGAKYVNPSFVDLPKNEPALWGVLRFVPNTDVLQKLLVSPQRGVTYTQTWLIVCLLLSLVVAWMPNPNRAQRSLLRWLSVFSILGFTAILWMNSCFNGWHGGATPGPRYLASILPVFALLIPLLYPKLTPALQQLLLVSLIPSLVLFMLVFSCKHVLAPESPLLEYYLTTLLRGDPGERLFRLLLISLGGAWAGYRAHKDIVQARLQATV